MCGIIAAASNKSVGKLLVQGLYKMEYRGYDSAGIALHQNDNIAHLRTLGKVKTLEEKMIKQKPKSNLGIAHTRWATHGKPSEQNAHPHKSNERIYIVHNGIIENHLELKNFLIQEGYNFTSETDSELIAHLLDLYLKNDKSILDSIYLTKEKLEGAYAIAIIDREDDEKIYIARNKSPLLIGIGKDENFAASDPLAIGEVADEFIILEDGDVACISNNSYEIYDYTKKNVKRVISKIDTIYTDSSTTDYVPFMAKVISGQPDAILNTFEGRVGGDDVRDDIFGLGSTETLKKVKRIQIVACGTSLHAGRVAANWFSAISGLPSQIDYASEYRYRNPHVDDDSLL